MDPERAKEIASQCWKSGSSATQKQNWEYAVEQFSMAAKLVPDNLVYRQSLRGAEYKMYKDNGTGARMSGMKLSGIKGRVKKAKGKEDWKTMNDEAESGLKINPWDAQLEAWVGLACEKMEVLDVAIFALSNAVRQEGDNTRYLQHLAELHLLKKNYDEALRLWEKIHKLEPDNGEARAMQTKIQTLKTMDRGNYDVAQSTQDVKAGKTAYDDDRKSKSSDPSIGPGDDPESDLKRQIRKNPDAFEGYQKLGDFYKRNKRLDDCIEMYKQAYEKSGENDDIREQLEDVQLEKLRNKVEDAKEAAKNNPDDEELQKKRQSLGNKLITAEIKIFSERIKRHKQDSRIKFELGKRYMRVKQWHDAIVLFQQCVADSRMETEVLVLMGECFLNDKKIPLAKRQFEKAVPNLSAQDHEELFKTAHYALGRIAERDGDRDKAEEHYGDILTVDYNYKDVLKRLERLQSGEGPSKD